VCARARIWVREFVCVREIKLFVCVHVREPVCVQDRVWVCESKNVKKVQNLCVGVFMYSCECVHICARVRTLFEEKRFFSSGFCCLSSLLGFAVWLFLFSSGVCTQLLSLFPSGFCSLVLLWGLQSLLGFAVSLCFSLSFNLDRAHASGRTHSINLSLSHTHAHIHVSYKF